MTATTAAPARGVAGEGGDPAGGSPPARARALAPALAARAAETEQARTLPPDLVAQLRQAGLFRLAMPVRLGGPGVDPRELVETVEEVSRADGAAGWCVLIANIGVAFLAWLDRDAAAALTARQPDLLVAGAQAPMGKGEPAGDGYRLSGRWTFASGCLHADWFLGGFLVTEDGRPRRTPSGAPEARVAYFPAEAGRIEDTWDVAGLAGTGSHDILVDQVQVPATHTSVPYFSPADEPEPLFRLTGFNLLLTLLSGFPLGVARRALDETYAQLGGDAGDALADPGVQVSVLGQDTALRAARRHVLDTLEELLAALHADPGRLTGPAGYARRAQLAAAVMHAYDVGREVVQECFRLAGPAAVAGDHPVQRCLRDLVAGSQHKAFSAETRTRVANALLGRQESPVFFGV